MHPNYFIYSSEIFWPLAAEWRAGQVDWPGGRSQGTTAGPRGLLLTRNQETSCTARDELTSSVESRPGCEGQGEGGHISGFRAQGTKIKPIPHSAHIN